MEPGRQSRTQMAGGEYASCLSFQNQVQGAPVPHETVAGLSRGVWQKP